MKLSDLKDKWFEIVNAANEKGIPIPMFRVDGKPSLSATMAIISFNVWIVAVVGKWSDKLGGVDPGQCLQMFLACAGLYWGRKFQSDGKKVEVSGKTEE